MALHPPAGPAVYHFVNLSGATRYELIDLKLCGNGLKYIMDVMVWLPPLYGGVCQALDTPQDTYLVLISVVVLLGMT
jgi:hypothetical protein